MLKQIAERRACRKYLPRKVEQEKIDAIVEAGLHAPSGMNVQDTAIIAITEPEAVFELAKINASIFGRDVSVAFYNAPAVLLVMAKQTPFSQLDGGATIENMLIEATNQGLGSCWIHRAKEELELEEGKAFFKKYGIDVTDYIGIGHVIVGYRDAGEPAPKVIKDGRAFYIK